MVFNQEHMLLQWEGSVRTGLDHTANNIESFTGSIRFAGPGLDQSDTDDVGGAVALVLTRWFASTDTMVPGNCFIELVKWNRIATSGLYKDLGNSRGFVTNGINPPQGTVLYPPQVALATTWTTDFSRGKACRGRTFFPTNAALDITTGGISATVAARKAKNDATWLKRLTEAARSGFVDNVSEPFPPFLTAIGWTPGTAGQGSGVSPHVMSKIGAGVSNVITGVGVGQRLDIQRRRGRSIPDTRASIQLSNAPA